MDSNETKEKNGFALRLLCNLLSDYRLIISVIFNTFVVKVTEEFTATVSTVLTASLRSHNRHENPNHHPVHLKGVLGSALGTASPSCPHYY